MLSAVHSVTLHAPYNFISRLHKTIVKFYLSSFVSPHCVIRKMRAER
jgi:hypothetical protein